ncbi:MAG: glycosyltransferase family 4 protein [bacterium]
MTHIALEISNLDYRRPTGVSRYMLELIREFSEMCLPEEVRLLYKFSWLKKRLKVQHMPFPLQPYDERYWTWFRTPEVVHGLDTLAPRIRSSRRVVTIHDVLVLQDCPDPVCSTEFRERKRTQFQQIAENCDAVITVSESSRRDLLNTLSIPEEKVFATPLGVSPRFRPAPVEEIRSMRTRLGLAKEYLLFVGDLSVRKNTTRLVKAFAQSGLDLQLVLAGRCSYRGEETLEAIRSSGRQAQIRWLDFVEDTDLPLLYSGALGFVFPTLYEGFGMPILEAMTCETPVMVGDQGAGPEVSGGLAVECHPYDLDSIAEGMRQLVTHPRTGLREHALQYTWKDCADRTRAIYTQLSVPAS